MWMNAYIHIIMLGFGIVCTSQHMDYTIHARDFLNYYDYPIPHGLRLQYLQNQQQYAHPHPKSHRNQYQYPHQYSAPVSVLAKEFESPDLDNAAFTMALTSQGYIIVDGESSTAMAPSEALVTKTQNSFIPITMPMHPHPNPHAQSRSHSHSHHHPKSMSLPRSRSNSQNVKLPLPLGTTPIAFEPLPLQSGAPYSTIRGLTSYGTPYAQRRR